SLNVLNSIQVVFSPIDTDRDPIVRKSKHMLQDLRGDNFNSFEFPVALKFRSEEKRIFNSDSKYRAYVLGGARLTRWSGLLIHYDDLKLESKNNRPVPEGLIMKPEYMS